MMSVDVLGCERLWGIRSCDFVFVVCVCGGLWLVVGGSCFQKTGILRRNSTKYFETIWSRNYFSSISLMNTSYGMHLTVYLRTNGSIIGQTKTWALNLSELREGLSTRLMSGTNLHDLQDN